MQRDYHRWQSTALGCEMEMLIFGTGGARVLVFPTAQGRFYDWEDRGLVGSLKGRIESGDIQLFCVDSVDSESWYAYYRPAKERIARHDAYSQYIVEEVIPFLDEINETPYLIAVGASLGAYHAVNLALRHPDRVQRVLGMSGIYDIRRFVHDYHDELVYFHNPVEYIAREHEASRLAALRQLEVILAVGGDDSARASNEAISELLWDKGIWHALRIWDGFAHDWLVWGHMLQHYLSGPD